MDKKRKIEPVVRKLSFTQAEEAEVEYYAGISWKESVTNVEEMRRNIWSREYELKMNKTVSVAHLKDDRDDFE